MLCRRFPALEPLSTQMLFPFTLDRRCPVVRRGARGLRLLPARPADDRELPAVPSAQSLEVRRPLHEFYKRGKSMICSCNCFPLAQNFPSRSTAAARRAGTAARGREVWQVRGCKTSPRRGRYHRVHCTAPGCRAPPGRKSPLFAFKITPVQPRQNIRNELKSPVLSLRLALASSCINGSWTALSPRPFLSRATAICLLREHLLGVHKGHSVPLNPSGVAGSAAACVPTSGFGSAVALAIGEPGERGGSFVPALFAVIMISPCSAHVIVCLHPA